MTRSIFAIVAMVAGCATKAPPAVPHCGDSEGVPSGSVELGVGATFMPVVEGGTVEVQPVAQYFFEFVVNARAASMDLGSGAQAGEIEVVASDPNGNTWSLGFGCRPRDFALDADGYFEMTEAYGVVFDPKFVSQLDGATVALHLELRDHLGHSAFDDRQVIAHIGSSQLPSMP